MHKGESLVKIKVSHLTQGVHQYRFHLQAKDFQSVAVSETMFPRPVEVRVTLRKGLSEMAVAIELETVATFECDRCLAAIEKRITGMYRIFYTQSGTRVAEELEQDEVRWLGKNDFEIDLTDDVRDTLVLAVPMKNVCEPTCQHLWFRDSTTKTEPEETEWQRALSQLSQKLRRSNS
ncbi:MAG: DUF177 domain-containing protein [Chloroherpetonaceae bacterium]|nr:DUF177 domain-containing protein [Chloroherpetonaceae bacterium]MCS7211783.1 DUF177 domain-containing protein [Chloroherpetonaceae bacterium]MDW8020460.1 DUF177 domain-containing protein [Chloroherpetonaceae bacterium]MDW8465332.1 DUF177 domain-containing protein [Chloroherpetonaceae bacterium]